MANRFEFLLLSLSKNYVTNNTHFARKSWYTNMYPGICIYKCAYFIC